MTAFEQAFGIVIGSEGGYVDNAADPGGRTKYGISQRSYPALDIAAMTLLDAQVIYKRDYWDKVRGDDLPPPLALLVFDAAVNCGLGRAARWLQAAVGVGQDGITGPGTLAAVQAGVGWQVMARFGTERLIFMAGLPTWRQFGKGWAARLERLPYQAMSMGAGA